MSTVNNTIKDISVKQVSISGRENYRNTWNIDLGYTRTSSESTVMTVLLKEYRKKCKVSKSKIDNLDAEVGLVVKWIECTMDTPKLNATQQDYIEGRVICRGRVSVIVNVYNDGEVTLRDESEYKCGDIVRVSWDLFKERYLVNYQGKEIRKSKDLPDTLQIGDKLEYRTNRGFKKGGPAILSGEVVYVDGNKSRYGLVIDKIKQDVSTYLDNYRDYIVNDNPYFNAYVNLDKEQLYSSVVSFYRPDNK